MEEDPLTTLLKRYSRLSEIPLKDLSSLGYTRDKHGNISRNTGETSKPAETTKEIAITKEEIRKIFSSEHWERLFREMIQATSSEFRETAFAVFRNVDSGYLHFSDLKIGKNDEDVMIYNPGEVEEEQTENRAVFGDLHTHPNEHLAGMDAELIILPSLQDNSKSGYRRADNRKVFGFDLTPINMIATETGDGEMSILVLQEPLKLPPKFVRRRYEEMDYELTGAESQQEVLDILHSFGYKAAIINTVNLKFPPNAIKTLEKFAYVGKQVKPQQKS